MSTFLYAFEAVMPVVLLIFLGYFLRRIGFLNEMFISVGYKFSFRVALPCMLFCNVYAIESFSAIDFRTVLYAMIAILVIFSLGVAAALIFVPDRRQRGVIAQCFFRSNSAIVGITLTEALGGASALQCVSVLTAFTIPLYNVLAVISLSAFCDDGENREKRGRFHLLRSVNWKKIGLNILKNPLIIAIALGFVCLGIRAFIPVDAGGEKVFLLSKQLGVIYSVISSVGRIASPFMMIILGGQFVFSAVKGMRLQIILGTVGRILIAPILAIGVAYLLSAAGVLDLGRAEYASYIAQFASPVAVSSAIMAREMGNDEVLAGQLVVWTSVGSMITVFLYAVLLRSLGLM